jgi:phytoene desaturase
MKSRSVIVIGAGVAGIAAAAHLAQRGLHVTVVEKNAHAGGRCDHFTRLGHRFDSGPTLLVMPLLYEAEFAALGLPLHQALDLQRVDPSYHLIFDDGSRLQLTSDRGLMRSQLEAIQPGSYRGFLRYEEEGRHHYELAMPRLVNRDFRSAGQFFNLTNLPLVFQLNPFVPHYDNLSRYFREPRLKAAFSFQDVYMGLSPFEAPATFSLMPYTELAHGVWYPKGGMFSIVKALLHIARAAGVEFVFDAAVEQIEVSHDRVRAVRLQDGRRLKADAILANADLPYVYKELLPADGLAEALEHKRYSCSAISFFWGVKKPYPSLAPHTLFLADDYRANFDSIMHDLTIPDNPSLYIHAPARLDPGMAPAGEDTLIAIVPVGHMGENGDQDWVAIRESARKHVFRRLASLGITDLEQNLKLEICYSPPFWRTRYNLVKGSTHGLCHNLMQLGYLRPHNRHAQYRNLYFTGASTHPGTGVPTALVSARLAARRMVDEWVE